MQRTRFQYLCPTTSNALPTNGRTGHPVPEHPSGSQAPRFTEITRTKRLRTLDQASLNELERVAHAKAAPGHVTRCPVGTSCGNEGTGHHCSWGWLESGSVCFRNPPWVLAAVHRGRSSLSASHRLLGQRV